MGNIFNTDFQEFIAALNNCNVEYVLVGGYSVIIHGYSRTTGDMDIWVNRTKDNYQKLVSAFRIFGMPVFDMTEYNFLENDNYDVFTFGRPPISIDLMNKVKGLQFDQTIENAHWVEIDGIIVHVISYNDLLKAKMASGRPKDADDIENLHDK